MNNSLLQSWWILALRGVAGIAFGLLALLWPGVTLLTLVALFAAYALIGGGASVAGAIRNRKQDENWWVPLLLGLVSLGAAMVAVMHPALTALVLVLLVGANALVTGVLDVIGAVRLRKLIQHEVLLGLSGMLSIAFGTLVFLFPEAGALAVVALLSFYAIATGVLLLALAFRLRSQTTAPVPAGERRTQGERRMTPSHST